MEVDSFSPPPTLSPLSHNLNGTQQAARYISPSDRRNPRSNNNVEKPFALPQSASPQTDSPRDAPESVNELSLVIWKPLPPIPPSPVTAQPTVLIVSTAVQTPQPSPLALADSISPSPIVYRRELHTRYLSPADRRNPRSAKKLQFHASPSTTAQVEEFPAQPRRSSRNPKPNNSLKGFEVGVKKKGKQAGNPSKKALQLAIKEAGLKRSILSTDSLTEQEKESLKDYCGLLSCAELGIPLVEGRATKDSSVV